MNEELICRPDSEHGNMKISLIRVSGIDGLWTITAETNGYLIEKDGKSLLVDCPRYLHENLLTHAALPIPEFVLHTHVQEEHCHEWSSFPHASVVVLKDSADIAEGRAKFFQDGKYSGLNNDSWDSDRGMERYGHGGCITERPPVKPLNVVETFAPGDVFVWQGQHLEFLALPGSGKYAGGIYWKQERVLFTGDLIYSGGYLANLYDLERCYGHPFGYRELRESIRKVMNIDPMMLLPTSGPIIINPRIDCENLLKRVEWIENPPVYRKSENYAMTNYIPLRQFGRYREILPGLFQNNNYGNIVLYIDAYGNGLIIDPDMCVWLTWNENVREMEEDLNLLEREAGLKKIDIALLTHYHGDHVRFCNLLRSRYGTSIMATHDVAVLIEYPDCFPYPVRIPWYKLPFSSIHTDALIQYNKSFDWHGISVTPIHTPGHCYAHTGFIIKWKGMLTVCTGDTLQYGAGPVKVDIPVIYNDTAWPERGYIVTFRHLAALKPNLVLGGHSHSFFDSDGSIISDFLNAAEESLAMAEEMLYDGGTMRAMTPPSYDDYRNFYRIPAECDSLGNPEGP